MQAYMCVCMYVYVYVCEYVRAPVPVCMYVRMRVSECMGMDMRVCTSTHNCSEHTRAYTCTYTCTRACTSQFLNVCRIKLSNRDVYCFEQPLGKSRIYTTTKLSSIHTHTKYIYIYLFFLKYILKKLNINKKVINK